MNPSYRAFARISNLGRALYRTGTVCAVGGRLPDSRFPLGIIERKAKTTVRADPLLRMTIKLLLFEMEIENPRFQDRNLGFGWMRF
jgi:hypothetical protein